jgi:hypothetical protein
MKYSKSLLFLCFFAIAGCSKAQLESTILLVSPDGQGGLTLQDALTEAADLLADKNQTTVIIELSDGLYQLSQPLVLDARFSGLVLRAAKGAHPVVSSGVFLDWTRGSNPPPGITASVVNQLWSAQIPDGLPIPNMLFDANGILPLAEGEEFKPIIDDTDPRMSDTVLYLPDGILSEGMEAKDLLISVTPPFSVGA